MPLDGIFLFISTGTDGRFIQIQPQGMYRSLCWYRFASFKEKFSVLTSTAIGIINSASAPQRESLTGKRREELNKLFVVGG